MTFQGALIKEPGVTFAVVIVQRYVLVSLVKRNRVIDEFASVFGYVPVVLMANDSRGTPTYYGREDIVESLARMPLRVIPWKEYSLV